MPLSPAPGPTNLIERTSVSDLGGRVAIVTGASKGIGAAIAKGLADAGASVAVNYASSREGAEQTVAAIEMAGGHAIAVQGDVSRADDARRIVDQTVTAFGSLDILVNNAAVFDFHALEKIGDDDFHSQFNVNVLGTLLMTQSALAHLGRGASIVNVGSAGILTPGPGSTVYAASKAAIDTMTQCWAVELGPRGIRVNGIRPGATETEGNHRLGTMSDPAMVQMLIDRTPAGRFGQPGDIAPTVVYLASDDAAWVTGEIVNVAGGYR